jgi:hypothetical protein
VVIVCLERRDASLIQCSACNPSDIEAQMAMLQKYRRSRFDIVGRVGDELAVRIVGLLDVSEVLSLRLVSDITNRPHGVDNCCDGATHVQVSREHAPLSRLATLWKNLCLELDRGQGVYGGSLPWTKEMQSEDW